MGGRQICGTNSFKDTFSNDNTKANKLYATWLKQTGKRVMMKKVMSCELVSFAFCFVGHGRFYAAEVVGICVGYKEG